MADTDAEVKANPGGRPAAPRDTRRDPEMSENQHTQTDTRAQEAPAPEAAAPETQAAPTPEERIAALEAETATLKDKWLRAEAEMQNLRARTQREVQEARAFATQKFAREVFFLAEEYSAQRAYEMGAVNRVVAHADLEREALALARTILTKSPTAIRMLKYAFNAVDDGMVGQQVFAGEATRLAYGTDEAVEGRDAFLEKRDPDWGPYPWHY